jgi:hypothetical protein
MPLCKKNFLPPASCILKNEPAISKIIPACAYQLAWHDILECCGCDSCFTHTHTHTWIPSQSGTFAKLWKATISFIMYVCLSFHMEQLGSIGRVFMRFDIWVFSKNLWRKLRFHSNMTRITCSLHEDLCTFLIISHWILHTMRNISDKCCRENQNTHFMFNKFFPPKNGAVY